MPARTGVHARARPARPGLHRFAPSGRVLAIAAASVVVLAGGYVIALETSIFAVRSIVVVGGSAEVKSEVTRALSPELGRSLLKVSSGDIDSRLGSVSDVLSVRFDREFPHTLRIVITPERAVMLLRRGSDTWLVSARARVLRQLRTPRLSSLPRVWVPASTTVSVGETLGPTDGALAAAALAPLTPHMLPAEVRSVLASASEMTLVLRSGFEVRLGDIGDLRLKLAIAQRIIRRVGVGPNTPGYLDVSVPERPVADVPKA